MIARRRFGTGTMLRKIRSTPPRLWGIGVVLVFSDLVVQGLRRLGIRSRTWPACDDRWPGVSVIIPERANANLLENCLHSLFNAIRNCTEPVEAIVVVNGSPKSDYDGLRRQFPAVRWSFCHHPLGFSAAIRKGLRMAVHDWVYLLNNDMVLAPDALAEVLRWRGPRIFGVASQIFFTDPNRRREETGWTDMHVTGEDGVDLFDVMPEAGTTVRGNLYAGGGASLFNRRILKRLISGRDPYQPFYWEDVEWGVRAWINGYEVLFCPTSVCWHHHRATVGKCYRSMAVERIFSRNRLQFELRNLPGTASAPALMRRIRRLAPASQRDIGNPVNCLGILLSRIRTAMSPVNLKTLTTVRRKFYFRPRAGNRAGPRILMVVPYAVFPPAHGGAVRINGLLGELGRRFDILLLSDEESLYDSRTLEGVDFVSALHLVGGRPDAGITPGDRVGRIESHCHVNLRNELKRLIDVWQPDIVMLEYIELAGLIDLRQRERWFLSLHDVLLSGTAQNAAADRYERALIRQFDEVTVCSPEDAALIPDRRVRIVPNGMHIDPAAHVPSTARQGILFMGPFRYSLNFSGIQRFLEGVYPGLRARIPNLSLVILGGSGARALAQGRDCFDQPGIRIVDEHVDPRPFLDRCALTINPLYGMRGSSLKLIESVAAGRICVSTRDGARGVVRAGIPSLIVVDRIEDFGDPIAALIMDEPRRLALERPRPERLAPFTWHHSARVLADMLTRRADRMAARQ